MEENLSKPHWKRLARLTNEAGNGRCEFDFQDGLPICVIKIEGKKKDIDLTKDAD